MPYHSVSRENGARVTMRRPLGPRNANASQMRASNPARRTPSRIVRDRFRRDSVGADGGAIEEKVAMAARYSNTHHQWPDQPIAAVSGVSWTIRMPIKR